MGKTHYTPLVRSQQKDRQDSEGYLSYRYIACKKRGKFRDFSTINKKVNCSKCERRPIDILSSVMKKFNI